MSAQGKEPMAERKAKGALIVPLAMIIRDQKQIDWLKAGLTEQDLKKIQEGILTSAWYDIGLMDRAGNAVYQIVGQRKPELGFEFGQGILCKILLSVYKGVLAKNDPAEMLARFANLYNGTWFQSGRAEFIRTETGGVIWVSEPEGIPCQEGFLHMLKGVFFRIIQENGGDNIQIECAEEAVYETRKLTALNYHLSWQNKKG